MGKLMSALIILGIAAIPVTSYVKHHSREVDRVANSIVQSVGEHVFGVTPEQPPSIYQMTESDVRQSNAHAAIGAMQNLEGGCFNQGHDLSDCYIESVRFRENMRDIAEYGEREAVEFYRRHNSALGLADLASKNPNILDAFPSFRGNAGIFADSALHINTVRGQWRRMRCMVREAYAQALRNIDPGIAYAVGRDYSSGNDDLTLRLDDCAYSIIGILEGRKTSTLGTYVFISR